MCMFIVWHPIKFSWFHNLHPWYWNSLLYSIISSEENSAHFLKTMPFTSLHFSFHQVPITVGWTEAAWYERLTQHLYTWPRVAVTHPSTNRAWHGLTSVIWRELFIMWPCALIYFITEFWLSEELQWFPLTSYDSLSPSAPLCLHSFERYA